MAAASPRIALAALAAVAMAAPAATATWVVAGGCRDGAPHGAYELRTADGKLRSAGAFNKGARSGSFFFWSSRGARIAQLPFEDDALSGTVALWYLPRDAKGDPPPKLEAAYALGRRQGTTRSWYPDGRLRAEFRYDRGQVADARAFGPAGAPLPDTEANALAARDLAADAEFLATLEALVREHPPSCAANGSSP